MSPYNQLHIILIILVCYSGLIWDEDLGTFLESSPASYTEPSQTCAICDSQAAKTKAETPFLNLGSIFYQGIVYHNLDFIYILNEQDEDSPYEIGQILSFSQNNESNIVQVKIRQLKYYDDIAKQRLNSFNLANWKRDEVCDNNFTYSLLIVLY